MMCLNRMRVFAAPALDHVRIQCSLRKVLHPFEIIGIFLKHAHKLLADDPAFLFRINYASQPRKEAIFDIRVDQAYSQAAGEIIPYLSGLPLPQQAMIYKNTGKLISYGFVHQGGHAATVNAA